MLHKNLSLPTNVYSSNKCQCTSTTSNWLKITVWRHQHSEPTVVCLCNCILDCVPEAYIVVAHVQCCACLTNRVLVGLPVQINRGHRYRKVQHCLAKSVTLCHMLTTENIHQLPTGTEIDCVHLFFIKQRGWVGFPNWSPSILTMFECLFHTKRSTPLLIQALLE